MQKIKVSVVLKKLEFTALQGRPMPSEYFDIKMFGTEFFGTGRGLGVLLLLTHC